MRYNLWDFMDEVCGTFNTCDIICGTLWMRFVGHSTHAILFVGLYG